MKELRKLEPNQRISDWLFLALYDAYIEAKKGKRKKPDEHQFELHHIEHLMNLRDEIIERRYRPSPGIAFITFKPVTREIFAAPFRDRIVHHFLFNACAVWWDRHFIPDSYSCREGKGTLYGIQRAALHMRRATKNHTEKAYIIKLDIQGYFMSLPRKKLYTRVMWGLDRQMPNRGPIYDICKYLWREIIFDDPTQGVKRRGWPKNWATLPPSKSLFTQPPGKGIVIGNLTSQLMSNIYLDQLDRFVTFDLGYKHYGRYVDDFYIIVPSTEYLHAKRDIRAIDEFLRNKLELNLHPKKRYIQEASHGMEFIGAYIYPHCLIPSKRLSRHFKNAVWEYVAGEKDDATITSYLGMMKHLDSKRLTSNVFDSVGWQFNY